MSFPRTAVGYTAWVRRAAAHPEVAAVLAAGEMSESFARTICAWTDKLPEDSRQDADEILLTAAGTGMGLRDLAGLADQDHRPAERLMGAVQQAGVIGLVKALAAVLAGPAIEVGAVDQPRPAGAPGPGGDQRGDRDALAALGGHLHHRSAAAPAPGASLRRPQALAGLVFEAEPGAQVRRRPFITGQVSSRQAAIAVSSRSAARRAGTCTLQPVRCSSTSSPARV